jgi:arylsulfatase A-like enzyme
MSQRRRRWLGCFRYLALGSLLSAASASGAGKPDIVVFLADDHGGLDSTPYGATDVRTPNMQRLADAGLKFEQAFVASPSCAPSRAALLTGLMPARNGAEANHTYPREEIRKLPAYLQELGYEVAAFGKVAHSSSGRHFGFDHIRPKFSVEAVADYLAGRDATRPLCLFVGTPEPHRPWEENRHYDPAALNLPPKHVDTPETRHYRARYYTDVELADTQLGQVYDLARRTFPGDLLFLYSSDHGAQWPFAKWNLYDTGIRVPLLAVWPGKLEPGSTTDAMVSWVDVLPTLVEVAGGTPPRDIDGRSFAAVLRGEATTHRDRIFSTHSGDSHFNVYPIRSVRTAGWKYILNPHPEYQHATHVNRDGRNEGVIYWRSWEARAKDDPDAAAKVARYRRRPREELYDLAADPHELRNLADDPNQAGRLAAFRAEVEDWMRDQGDAGRTFDTPLRLDEEATPF